MIFSASLSNMHNIHMFSWFVAKHCPKNSSEHKLAYHHRHRSSARHERQKTCCSSPPNLQERSSHCPISRSLPCDSCLSFRLYTPIHITLTTMSIPLLSPPSYLKLHMPSRSLFQYAPLALCIPLRPTFFTSPSASVVASSAPALRGSDRCWMIVLLTANL